MQKIFIYEIIAIIIAMILLGSAHAYYVGQVITQAQLDRQDLNNLSWSEVKDLFSCNQDNPYYERPIYYHPFHCNSIIPYGDDYIVIVQFYYPHFHIDKYRLCRANYTQEECISGLYEYILRPMAKRMVYEDISRIQEYQNRYSEEPSSENDIL